jgi:flagellar biosynthesis/type III secretory pathway chaperone
MRLPEILQTLQQNLMLLVETLRQEQNILLLPQGEDEEHAEQLSHWAREKQRYFRMLECFSDQRDDLMNVLTHIGRIVMSTEERARCLSLWREVDELVAQAARLDHANGTLIRHRLNHNQLVLRSLREIKWTLTSVTALNTETDIQFQSGL